MADVPDQAVARRVENVMERHRQFDDAKPGTEMAAGLRHRVDEIGAQLVGDLLETIGIEPPQLGRGADLIEKRRLRGLVQRASSVPTSALGTPRWRSVYRTETLDQMAAD